MTTDNDGLVEDYMRISFRSLVMALLIGTFAVPAAVALAQTPQPPNTAAQEGFVPVDQVQQKEQLPAAPLVMAAYAVAWLVIFGYVWSVWQRLARVQREIADVSRRVASGGRR